MKFSIAIVWGLCALQCGSLPVPATQSEKNDELFRTLIQAAENGDKTLLLEQIERGAKINQQDQNGWTPLCVAVWNRQDVVADLLIEKGADVNKKLNSKWTALHMAAENGHEGLVGLLLKNGADVNATTIEGWTPLDLAIENERPKAIILLQNAMQSMKLSEEISSTTTISTQAQEISTHASIVEQDSLSGNKNANIGPHALHQMSEKPISIYSVASWNILAVGLGIVAAIIIVNIIPSIRGRMRRTESKEMLANEEDDTDSLVVSYAEVNTNQQTQIKRVLA